MQRWSRFDLRVEWRRSGHSSEAHPCDAKGCLASLEHRVIVMARVNRPSTPFMDAVDELLWRISDAISESFKGRVEAVLVGGAAVHTYTQSRPSKHLDARFSHRMSFRTIWWWSTKRTARSKP